MNKLNIKLQFQGKDELDDIVKKVAESHDFPVDIDLGTIHQGIDKINKSLDTPIGKLKQLTTQTGFAIMGIKQIYSALDNTMGSFIRAAQDADTAMANVKAALRATGLEAETNAHLIDDFANKMQQLTIYDDETIKYAMAKMQNMARFETTQMLQNATEAAIGLAAAFQLDLNTAMDLVSKAAAGNTALLGRYGIILDETATQAEKFASVLAIGGQYFSVAEAQANSAFGAISQLKNAWNDLQETLAEAVVPSLSKAAMALKTIVDAANQMTHSQRAITAGLLIMNALVIKNALAIMSQKAAFTALTIEQQKQVVTLIALTASQTGATLGTLTFSAAMKALWASIIAATNAVKTFLVSIGPLGWAIIGITTAYMILTSALKDTSAAQKDLNDAQLKQMQQQKELTEKRIDEKRGIIELTHRYQELANTTNRSVSQQKELRSIHDQLSSRYPDLISSTDSYTNSLEGVKKAAHNAQLSINELSRQQQALSINILKTEMESLRLEALETLTKEFTYWDKRTTLTPARQSALAVLDNAKKYLRENTVESDSRLLKLGSVKDMLNRYKDDANILYDKEMAAIYDALTSLQMIESKKSEYDRLRSQPILPTSVVDFASSVSSSQLASDPAQNIRKRLEEFELAKSVRFEEQQTELLLLEKKYREEKKKLIVSDADKLNSLKEEYEREQNLIAEKYRKKEQTETEKHYNDLKFYDSTYYEWKKQNIQDQAELLFQNQNDKEYWIAEQTKTLQAEKLAWDMKPIAEFEALYQNQMSHLAELRQLGLATYSEIADAAWQYYHALKNIVSADGTITQQEQQLLDIYLKRAQAAQLAVNREPDDMRAYYDRMRWMDDQYYQYRLNNIIQEVEQMEISEKQKQNLKKKLIADLNQELQDQNQKNIFSRMMDAMSIAPDQQKGIIYSYQRIASSIQNVWAGLYSYLENKRQKDLENLENRAKKERKTNVWLAAEKEKVEEDFAKKQKAMKKAEQKMQIVSATANTLEGITNALTIKPAWLAPIAATAIGALGFAQVALLAAQKFATGGLFQSTQKSGLFRGKGTQTSDSNLIAISDHEYIINAARVKAFGVPFFDALNFGNGEQIRKALSKVKPPNVTLSYPINAPGYAAGGSIQTNKSTNLPLNLSMNVELKCDKKALAKAVIKGQKMILST